MFLSINAFSYLVQLYYLTVLSSAENNNKDNCNKICSVVYYFTNTKYNNSDFVV